MKAFTTHRGLVALLNRGNVDTDQIIPKQFLKSIKKTGYGESCFFDWRYLSDGSPNLKFELNEERFQGASILVAGNNFACGSSREHAVWAIQQMGFAVVIAPSFADIFKNNSVKNGLVTIELSAEQVEQIKKVLAHEEHLEATVDLTAQTITLHPGGDEHVQEHTLSFQMDVAAKERLTKGLDDIGMTLEHEQVIAAFESKHNPQNYPLKK